jgi:hypothetical protein
MIPGEIWMWTGMVKAQWRLPGCMILVMHTNIILDRLEDIWMYNAILAEHWSPRFIRARQVDPWFLATSSSLLHMILPGTGNLMAEAWVCAVGRGVTSWLQKRRAAWFEVLSVTSGAVVLVRACSCFPATCRKRPMVEETNLKRGQCICSSP